MNKQPLAIIGAGLILLIAVVTSSGPGQPSYAQTSPKAVSQAKQAQEVYDTCNESRISVEISEKRCGELQDKYSLEFLCSNNNRELTNHCHVE